LIRLENVRAVLGNFVLEIEELEVRRGEYFVILGPSGVGKTLLLNIIAGILKPQRGKIVVDGRDVTNEPPERRGIALVPQEYALFPHMTVYENIAYGLRVRKVPKDVVCKEVEGIARVLEIEDLLDRKPSTLSGGEKQRVALARALIVRPKALLLDEPLASLDPRLRYRARILLKSLHKRVGFTAIHVTHNIAEAVSLADRIGYMEEGRLVDVFGPREFVKTEYARPYIDELKEVLEAIK
jgi:molybdate/tungstate transport system ATP-binding protein